MCHVGFVLADRHVCSRRDICRDIAQDERARGRRGAFRLHSQVLNALWQCAAAVCVVLAWGLDCSRVACGSAM
eukprot:9450757-Alexandrium_andersonii.AAC.1